MIHKKRSGFIAAVLLVTAAAGTGAGPPVFSDARLATSINSAAVREAITRLDQLARDQDTDGLWAAIVAIERAQYRDLVAKPYLRYHAVMRMAQVPETPAARTGLTRYLGSSDFVQVWFDESGHQIPVQVFDAASAARFALGSWNRRAWSEQTRSDLAAGRTAFLAAWVQAATASGERLASDGIQDALSNAPPADLQLVREELIARLLRGEPVAAMARTVAIQLRDVGLASLVMGLADTPEALAMLNSVSRFSQPRQLELLETALSRHDLGSAAIYRLGSLPLPDAERLLIAHLDSSALGGSAAAALARKANPALVDELADIVRDQNRPAAQMRAVLALRLAPDGIGLGVLEVLAEDNRVQPAVRSEIARRLP